MSTASFDAREWEQFAADIGRAPLRIQRATGSPLNPIAVF